MAQIRWIAAVVLLVILLFLGLNSFYAVNEWEQVVITQFGRIKRPATTDAGLHFKLPFIQDVHRFEKRLLRWDGPETTTISKDRKTLILNVTARWRIADPTKFLETIRTSDPAAAHPRLNGLVQGAVKDEIAKYELFEVIRSSDRILEATELEEEFAVQIEEEEQADLAVLGRDIPELATDSEGNYQAGRPAVIRGILSEARNRLEQVGLGIQLEDVLIRQLNYSPAIEGNVYGQMNAGLAKISAGLRSHGQQDAEERLGEMQRELQTIQSEARQKAEVIRGEAEAEAIRIYAEAYNSDPDFYRFLRTLKTYERVIGKNSTLVLGTDSPLYSLFKDLTASELAAEELLSKGSRAGQTNTLEPVQTSQVVNAAGVADETNDAGASQED